MRVIFFLIGFGALAVTAPFFFSMYQAGGAFSVCTSKLGLDALQAPDLSPFDECMLSEGAKLKEGVESSRAREAQLYTANWAFWN